MKLLDSEAAAEHLKERGFRATKMILNQWRHYKVGPPYIKIGRFVYYQPEDLDQWLSEQVTAGRIA